MAALLTLTVLGGCRSGSDRGFLLSGRRDSTIRVEVRNDNFLDATVYAIGGGASVRMGAPANVGRPYVVGLWLPGLDGTVHECTVAAEVRSTRPAPPPQSGHVVGMSFTHLSPTARDRLAEYCRVLLPARVAAVATDDAPPGPTEAPRQGGRSRGGAGRKRTADAG